jgi:hypothetical protein
LYSMLPDHCAILRRRYITCTRYNTGRPQFRRNEFRMTQFDFLGTLDFHLKTPKPFGPATQVPV